MSGVGNSASGSTTLNGAISGFGNAVNVANTVGVNFGMSGMFNTGLPGAGTVIGGQIGADSGLFNAGSFLSGLLSIGRL